MSQSDSIRNKAHNLLMRQKIKRRLDKNGLLLAIAATGSNEKQSLSLSQKVPGKTFAYQTA